MQWIVSHEPFVVISIESRSHMTQIYFYDAIITLLTYASFVTVCVRQVLAYKAHKSLVLYTNSWMIPEVSLFDSVFSWFGDCQYCLTVNSYGSIDLLLVVPAGPAGSYAIS